MATSIRDLKKEVKAAFEELIGDALMMQLASGADHKKTDPLINEIVETYETIIRKINAHRQTKDKKAYFGELNKEIAEKLNEFRTKIEAL